MPNHKCKFCDFQTVIKSQLARHLNKKNKCYERDNVFNDALESIEKSKRPINQDKQLLEVAINKIATMEEQISELEKELSEVDVDTEFLDKINELLEEAKTLRIETAEKDARIEELEAKNAEKDEEIEKIITNRDDVIAKYKERIQKYKDRLNAKDAVVQKEPTKQAPTKILFM
jgi:chromosome segregation ATPase